MKLKSLIVLSQANTGLVMMGIFTFITYVIQHIPDKHFRVVRGYGLFSHRLKGKLLPQARMLLDHPADHDEKTIKTWRERIYEYREKDPLFCESCSLEMILVQVCFGLPMNNMLSVLGLSKTDHVPRLQIQLYPDTS